MFEPPRAGWIEILRSTDVSALSARSLVLTATGIEHDVRPTSDGHALSVRVGDERAARLQLERWQRENVGWPEPEPTFELVGSGWPGTCAFVLVLFALYQFQRVHAVDWVDQGLLDVARVRAGEWWRCVTALFLHADVVHVAGNMAFGAFFVFGVCQVFGSGLGPWAVLCSGTAANAIECAIKEPTQRSLGASTAVFAALGILAALRMPERATTRKARMRKWAPLVAGLCLLGLLGQGGERTDVLGHLLGMLTGLVTGSVFGAGARRRRDRFLVQAIAGFAALALIVSAWWFARHAR
ncbi:MAG: rhomboid family intramembrane serine protease [Planctomycetes bacterium]|nr:rhomboid family intramembrane serine protease [Planctomycetota bacterium]MCC7170597.1 rhomboid family intramembrane serine protease [Planctomycetota bacterium]